MKRRFLLLSALFLIGLVYCVITSNGADDGSGSSPINAAIEISPSDKLEYGDKDSLHTLKIKNPSGQPVTLTLDSDGKLPLAIRTGLAKNSVQFEYQALPCEVQLAAGQEKELVLALTRRKVTGDPATLFESVLHVRSSKELIGEVEVSARVTSPAGLWVGAAVVADVNFVDTTAVDTSNAPQTQNDELKPAQPPPAEPPPAEPPPAEPQNADCSKFPLRLILHRDNASKVRLLQQVFLQGASDDQILTTQESLLDREDVGSVCRISSATFPLGMVVPADGNGDGDIGGNEKLRFVVELPYSAATNPFLHTYHPDHDNLDAQSPPKPLEPGVESYTVTRTIELTFVSHPAALRLSDPGWGSTTLGGTYRETITGLRAQPVSISGDFVLHRVSPISILTSSEEVSDR